MYSYDETTLQKLMLLLRFTKLLKHNYNCILLWMLEEHYCFITCSEAEMSPYSIYLILLLHFTKSLKRDNIYNLCLWILEELTCLVGLITPLHLLELRYRACAWKHVLRYMGKTLEGLP